ncbi:hypothetical protein [Bradyrhizobium sp. USDA 4451]
MPSSISAPQFAHLSMPTVYGRANGVAGGLEIVTFQKMDLGLDQAAACKFDPAQTGDKWIICRRFDE